jgi:hypothetical protein
VEGVAAQQQVWEESLEYLMEHFSAWKKLGEMILVSFCRPNSLPQIDIKRCFQA